MASSSKPTFLIVPGVLHPAKPFEELTEALKSRAYDSIAVDPPWVANDAPHLKLEDYKSFVRGEIAKLTGQGKDVVVVAHSMGGMYTPQAIGNLVKKPGSSEAGVTGLVAISSVILDENDSVENLIKEGVHHPPAADNVEQTEQGTIIKPTASMNDQLFHGLPAEARAKAEAELRPQSFDWAVVTTPASGTPWRNQSCPKTYVFASEDQMWAVAEQEAVVGRLKDRVKADGHDLSEWRFEYLPSGHSPHKSHTNELADILVKSIR